MVSSQFEAILKDFEPFFKCRLQADQNESCLIKMGHGISLQMELNRYGLLLIGCRIGELPRGRFQDDVIREALKANDFYPPLTGIFGISRKSNSLILYLIIDPHKLDQDKISNLLNPFIAKAKLWSDSVNQGNIPTLGMTAPPQQAAAPPFGFSR